MTALNTQQVMETFQIKSVDTVMELFRRKGSPAFKIGRGRGHWRVNETEFKEFLKKESEKFKG